MEWPEVKTKPNPRALFNEKVLRRAVGAFDFPEDIEQRHQRAIEWVKTLQSGALEALEETSPHGDFLRGFFVPVLGYRTVVGGEGRDWSLHPEKTVATGGSSADGALGRFNATQGSGEKVRLEGRLVAPIELEGAEWHLDRLTADRKETPVQRGWRYATETVGCKWIVVSNYREIRLYHLEKTTAFYEASWLEDLQDFAAFKRFYFLLCARNMLPPSEAPATRSALDHLLSESDEVGERITRELYNEYQEIRKKLVNHLWNTRPMNLDRASLLTKAQTILDRMLFLAFCEDQRLLPPNTIQKACDFSGPHNPTPIWDRYKAVFGWVNEGCDTPRIHKYDGGLFSRDSLIDENLTVPDDICRDLARLATRYDFETEVSVEVLGRIFEQSVSDLEELRAIATGAEFDRKQGVRKSQGIYYTPPFITQYIVDLALGGYLRRREESLRRRFGLDTIPGHHSRKRADAEQRFWRAYRDDVLKRTRVVDPACGSGAFLIAAFDHLQAEYARVNDALADLEGDQNTLESLDKTLLTSNLYGVDLSAESVEITRLSLWLKTAQKNRALTFLDANIQQGNSLIADRADHPDAFDWRARFPDVFSEGGFDVVVGNPPYVRQELLGPYKDAFQRRYQSYDAVADLYTYFYELGVDILKADGLLSYIVTNKWMRSGYGASLRAFFASHTVFEDIIDFGHAPIFEDADVFPCIVSVRKDDASDRELTDDVRVCRIAKASLPTIHLAQHVQQHGYRVPWSSFGAESWNLDPPEAAQLLVRLKAEGVPLAELAGTKPCYGIKTGCNKAFVVDDATARTLIHEDARSGEIIKPFLRGKDIRRWRPDRPKREWLVFTRRGVDMSRYPAVLRHLESFRQSLEPRPRDWDQASRGKWPGRKPGPYAWYELQDAVDYYEIFEKPKIVTKDLVTYSWFSLDVSGAYPINTCYVWPTDDLYVLGWMNSPLAWWIMHRTLQRAIGDTLRMFRVQVETLPVAPPTHEIRTHVEECVLEILQITDRKQRATEDLTYWLIHEFGLKKPGPRLLEPTALSESEFIEEARTRRGKRSVGPGLLRQLRDAYVETVGSVQADLARERSLERSLADLICRAQDFSEEDVALMWKTAPVRMPTS